MRLTLFALVCLGLATPALAQGLVPDAWGLAPQDDRLRRSWAGVWGDAVNPASDPHDILLFVGQKSLVAGQDIGMAAALVLDKAGNLVADDTPVTIMLDRRAQETRSRNGIATSIIRETLAGHYHAGAAAGAVQSNRAEYDIIPDLLSVTVAVTPDDGLAQVEAFHDFGTQPLRDRFGNALVGGTATNFVMRAQDGTYTFLSGQVTGGAGQARMLARDMGESGALSGQITAIVGSRASTPEPYSIRPLKSTGPLAIDLNERAVPGLSSMTIGPFLTDAGHYLNDGAPVRIVAFLADGQALSSEAWVQDGKVVIDWLLPSGAPIVPVSIASPHGQVRHDLGARQGGQP